jgi:thymidine kinase
MHDAPYADRVNSSATTCVRCGAPADGDLRARAQDAAQEQAEPLLCAVCEWQQAGRQYCSG